MTTLLTVENLAVNFEVPVRNHWPWTPSRTLAAVDEISFSLGKQETLGIVGESGSGKTTLARAIVGTVPVRAGRVLWDGADLARMDRRSRREVRRDMPMIFQNPVAALNPRMTVGRIIAEPLRTHNPDVSKAGVRARVGKIMERVGLLPNLANRYPHEFSGGQCQRIGIARALVLKPRLVICDEPVAALDVSVRAQVINLLRDLQRDFGLALIVISHDLSVVRAISNRTLVMYLGRMMELADTPQLIAKPLHPYTRALISSVPVPDPAVERARSRPILQGNLPSPFDPPAGCAFASRCPQAQGDCTRRRPALETVAANHQVACPYHGQAKRNSCQDIQ